MIIQRLVSNGHRLHDIQDYTIPQFFAFLDAIDRADRHRTAEHIYSTAVAAQGDSKAIDKAIKALK